MSDWHGRRPNAGPCADEQSTNDVQLFDHDAELRLHNERFRAATSVGPHNRVLDIGCGTGQSTREAARAAVTGSVLGVDLSARMLEQARRLSHDEGLRNVTYLRADAERHPFPPAQFDVGISRFGTMFFANPVTAFTNIWRALQPPARLVLLVWQGRDRNEWSTAVHRALTGTAVPTRTAAKADPFSLGDPATTTRILTTAGFTDLTFTDIHEPVYYGPDATTAYHMVLRLREPQDLLASLDSASLAHAHERLRATLAAHDVGDGVYFDSQAWIITAHRR